MGDEQLKLLMSSYKEQIELNTKLMERQKWFLESLEGSTQRLIEAIHAQTSGLQGTMETGIAQLGQKMTEEHLDLGAVLAVAPRAPL